MEVLHGVIGGVGYKVEVRMPSRIYASTEQRVVLHVYLPYLAVHGNYGTSILLAGMELHLVWVVVLVTVAVDALLLTFAAAKHIVVDNRFIEILQTSLVDGQFLVCNV